ncbi:hypothetical protein BGZ97_003942 [Linnemannia gamsii]|jgi:hypothetical protein|uniref:Uncharacterized protein n=1 Tax=Linnemannia gamsii TaxID=64522 RepID=A0A9P6RGU0_9FUNG|nr:hypothetical protein BGZ97_003942 [Linnemannia gamsii]
MAEQKPRPESKVSTPRTGTIFETFTQTGPSPSFPPKAKEVVEKHQCCDELHGRVYDRLPETSRFRVLDFEYEHWGPFEFDERDVFDVDGCLYAKCNPPIYNTLELSLESGQSQLSALRKSWSVWV